jgi:hypothetical protein
MNRTLVTIAGLLLLAGCTNQPLPQPLPVKTLPPTSSPAATTDTGPIKVHIVLHIESDQPAIIRYSNGVTTKNADMALEGNGDAGTMDVELDAPQPYIAVATITTAKPGKLTCNMTVKGSLVDQPDWADGDLSTVKHGTFAMCRSIMNLKDAEKPSPTDHSVQLKTKTSGNNDWSGWAGSSSAGEAVATGTSTTEVSQAAGPVRLVVVATEAGDKVTCRIVDGEDSVGESSDDYGDILTCTTTIRG